MKIPLLFPVILILFILSCNNDESIRIDETRLDSTLKVVNNQVEEEIVDSSSLSPLDSFLLKPFDLYKFKQAVGQCNSGGGGKQEYRYRPGYDGMYYDFFLCSRLMGYLGARKTDTIKMEDGLRITTYKRFNEFEYDYLDTTEVLIEVEAKFNNHHLPELAFVGLNTKEIKAQLGPPTFKKGNCYVYTYLDRILVLSIKNSRVEWLRYVHLKSKLMEDKIFDKLFVMN